MASRRKYAYYIKGNKIAIIEEGLGSGVCSLSGYSNQTTCEAAGGTWTENAISKDDGNWRSPTATVADGLEIQYTYSPTYRLPSVVVDSSTAASINKFFVNGWIAVGGYLTLIAGLKTWTSYSKIDVDDNILISGSERWNGLHKIQEIQTFGDVIHGSIKTYTKVPDSLLTVPYTFDGSVSWNADETITNIDADSIENAFVDSTTTPYIWIMGSDEALNNGMFSDWSFSGTTLTLSAATQWYISDDYDARDNKETWEHTLTPTLTSDTSEDIYIYKAYRESGMNFITDVTAMTDEDFELDLNRYQSNAVVYYLKAKLAEDMGDMELREYFLREFKKQLEKSTSALKRGPYIVQGFKQMR